MESRNSLGRFTNGPRLEKRKFSDELLLRHWSHRDRKVKDIAKILGVYESTVIRRLKKIGIKVEKNRFKKGHKQRVTHGVYLKIKQYRSLHPNCEICDWKYGVDIHHITPVRHGGTNGFNNLVALCPNHHRLADKKLLLIEKTGEGTIFLNLTEVQI